MLIHIVCWKYRADTPPPTREQHIAMLKSLPGKIECIETFDVGSDILRLERSFDTGLVAGFKDRAALDEYTVHPDHQAVAAFGKQIAEKVVSVDFEGSAHTL
jgi:hypothetical protein